MFVNRYRLNPGYIISFGRLKIAAGVHQDSYILYDSEGYREAPPSALELRSILSGMGLWLRQRSQLPAELYTPEGVPLVRSQLQRGAYLLDRACNKIYSSRAAAPYFRVFGTKYVCWKPRPEEGPDYHAAPLQQYITTTSVKSKKELAAFAVWLDKVRDVNVVVNTMHPGMTKLHADTSKILTHLYKTGLSPAAAYAELPEANWVFPDADKFNVGTEVLELPHIVWR